MAVFGTKRMLLTGDERGDDILAALKAARMFKRTSVHVDLLKVPHHGSDRNVEQGFFEQVTADGTVNLTNVYSHIPHFDAEWPPLFRAALGCRGCSEPAND